MDYAGIREVLTEVFGRGFESQEVNGWASIRCPLGRYLHEKGGDTRPSAGISIQPNGVSVFSCFTCGNKAPLQGMLRKYANFTGDDLDDLIKELDDSAYLGAKTLPSWEELKGTLEGLELPNLDPAIYLDLYPSAAGHPYLLSRFISEATATKLQLMVDPEDPVDGEERILFPVFGPTGVLHGFSGRATSPNARLKVRDYHGLRKAECILGAHLVEREKPNRILVVEGLIDYANAWECGYPGVAVMHSSMTMAQASIIRAWSRPTYLFYDNDLAGQKGVDIAGPLLAPFLPVNKVRYLHSEIWDEKLGDYRGVKDPGELLPEEFESMIQDSRMY